MAVNNNLKNSIMIGPGAAVLDPKAVPGFYCVDNLRALQPADLEDEKVFVKIAMLVRDLDDDGAGFRAKECFEILMSLIEGNENSPTWDEGLLRRYFDLLIVLKVNFLGLLEDKGVESFLREQALLAISVSLFSFPGMDFLFDLKDKIVAYLKFDIWYLGEENKKEILRLFIQALETNEEYLGEDDLRMADRLVPQTMANWLLDYNQSAHSSFGKRTSFERARYLNTSPAVRNLDEAQKKILEKFLEFYDWLKFEAVGLVHSERLKKLNELVVAEGKKLIGGIRDFRFPELPKVAAQEPKADLGVVSAPPAGDIKQPFPPSSSTLPAPPSLTPVSRPLSADATGRALPTLSTTLETGKGEGIEGKGGKGEDRTLYQSPQAAPVQGAADRTDRLVVPPKDEKGERGVMGGMGVRAPVEYEEIQRGKGIIGGMGEEEMGQGKGLKFGGGDIVKPFVKPTPSSPKASLDKSVSGSPSPQSSPSRERKNVDIDQKLEELKKKAERNKTKGQHNE